MLKKVINPKRSHKGGQAIADYALVISFVAIACLSMVTIVSVSLHTQLDPLERVHTKLPADPAF